jgi:hypothetical protein
VTPDEIFAKVTNPEPTVATTGTWSTAPGDPIADIQALLRRLNESRKRLLCAPEDLARVSEVVRDAGLSHLVSVESSSVFDVGEAFYVDPADLARATMDAQPPWVNRLVPLDWAATS